MTWANNIGYMSSIALSKRTWDELWCHWEQLREHIGCILKKPLGTPRSPPPPISSQKKTLVLLCASLILELKAPIFLLFKMILIPHVPSPIIIIGPGGLLLVVPHLYAIPVSVLWVGLHKSIRINLDAKKYFAESHPEHRCRCST